MKCGGGGGGGGIVVHNTRIKQMYECVAASRCHIYTYCAAGHRHHIRINERMMYAVAFTLDLALAMGCIATAFGCV